LAVPAQAVGDDGALVRAVQRGDSDAFAELFRRHYPEVQRACARRLLDPVEADEVAQAAFVRAFERIDQCAGQRQFRPWVHVIARSLCIDAFRAQARVEPREEPFDGQGQHRPNEPEESVLSQERAAQIHQALADLPDRQRRAVIARDWEELRPGEIAERLGLTVGAVDSLLLRARRGLALSYRRLAGEGGGGTSALPIRSAAGVGVALTLAPQAVLAAWAAAAHAVQDTASRAAGGVVSAVISLALSLGAGVSAPPTPPPPGPEHGAVEVSATAPQPPMLRMPVRRRSPPAPPPTAAGPEPASVDAAAAELEPIVPAPVTSVPAVPAVEPEATPVAGAAEPSADALLDPSPAAVPAPTSPDEVETVDEAVPPPAPVRPTLQLTVDLLPLPLPPVLPDTAALVPPDVTSAAAAPDSTAP
jgi:RNA polymerase sigma-70 factor (ECF subfamily)